MFGRATESLEEVQASAIPTATKVFVNGGWVGIHHDPDSLVSTLKDLRRAVDISAEASIYLLALYVLVASFLTPLLTQLLTHSLIYSFAHSLR